MWCEWESVGEDGGAEWVLRAQRSVQDQSQDKNDNFQFLYVDSRFLEYRFPPFIYWLGCLGML